MSAELHQYLTLAAAARLVPGEPAPAVLWRWCRQGLKARSGQRVRLCHVRIGREIHITEGALTEFFEALAAADLEKIPAPKMSSPPAVNTRQRSREIENANKELAAAGI